MRGCYQSRNRVQSMEGSNAGLSSDARSAAHSLSHSEEMKAIALDLRSQQQQSQPQSQQLQQYGSSDTPPSASLASAPSAAVRPSGSQRRWPWDLLRRMASGPIKGENKHHSTSDKHSVASQAAADSEQQQQRATHTCLPPLVVASADGAAISFSLNEPSDASLSVFPSNAIRTSKYNVLTFLPLNLFEQFRRLANQYFLVIVVLQLIPGVSPFPLYTSITPLVFILAVSALSEAREDWVRHRADSTANNRRTVRLTRGAEEGERHRAGCFVERGAGGRHTESAGRGTSSLLTSFCCPPAARTAQPTSTLPTWTGRLHRK